MSNAQHAWLLRDGYRYADDTSSNVYTEACKILPCHLSSICSCISKLYLSLQAF